MTQYICKEASKCDLEECQHRTPHVHCFATCAYCVGAASGAMCVPAASDGTSLLEKVTKEIENIHGPVFQKDSNDIIYAPILRALCGAIERHIAETEENFKKRLLELLEARDRGTV